MFAKMRRISRSRPLNAVPSFLFNTSTTPIVSSRYKSGAATNPCVVKLDLSSMPLKKSGSLRASVTMLGLPVEATRPAIPRSESNSSPIRTSLRSPTAALKISFLRALSSNMTELASASSTCAADDAIDCSVAGRSSEPLIAADASSNAASARSGIGPLGSGIFASETVIFALIRYPGYTYVTDR